MNKQDRGVAILGKTHSPESYQYELGGSHRATEPGWPSPPAHEHAYGERGGGRSAARSSFPWSSLRKVDVIAFQVVFSADSPQTRPVVAPGEASAYGWTVSPAEVLARLADANASPAERGDAAVIAETMAFDASWRPRLLTALAGFISEHRFTADEDAKTALGSAIRKYAMNMDEASFDSYAAWLATSPTEALSHEVELELAKGACWRLSFGPVRPSLDSPELKTALYGIASEYVTPRLILQRTNAATALNAIVAVVILDALANHCEQTSRLLTKVAQAQVKWFAEMMARRLADAAEAVAEHDAALATNIRLLISANPFTRDGAHACQATHN